MEKIIAIFERLENITQKEGQSEFVLAVRNDLAKKDDINIPCEGDAGKNEHVRTFIFKIINAVDELASELLNDSSILISVKNQKTLRTCFQLVTSVGISNCMIPGLGISLKKRCSTANILPKLTFKDEEKYEILVNCTHFFTRCYKIPVFKNIIVSLHLSDYLAALIQLSFAPLKVPGTYKHFVMTQEMYDKLIEDRKHFVLVYKELVVNCFQPTLMKELLVLQSVTKPPPPVFAKRLIAKELSQRLLAPGGLLSLIRCFIENYDIDTGLEWQKIDMLCRLVSCAEHGISENDYLINISLQLAEILSMTNTYYLTSAVACVISLHEKYPYSHPVLTITNDIFQSFDYTYLRLKSSLPGIVILSPQEVNHKVDILHACVGLAKLHCPISLLSPNLYVLFMIGSKCTKHVNLQAKLTDILLKCLEKLSNYRVAEFINKVLFGNNIWNSTGILIEEYDSGIAIKTGSHEEKKPEINKELVYFLTLFKSATEINFAKYVFEALLNVLVKLSIQRKNRRNKDLLTVEDEPILDDIDEQYATILQLLSEISESPKVVTALKNDPYIVINFIEHFLLKGNTESNEDCTSVALVLLNTVLSNIKKDDEMEKRFSTIFPVLKRMSKDESSFNHILCKEALSLLTLQGPVQSESACEKAITDVFDDLLPVRAHGIMKLTKLIEAKDPETISKKHYLFCLFQELLKDPDSYIYLSAINALATLCTLSTEDVLNLLCKEYMHTSNQSDANAQKKAAETRMKIGDVIVKITKGLGEMAVVYKTELLNTMLNVCRDTDPLIRTSALSNLAEIALVLNYKIGKMFYELKYCIMDIIKTDEVLECRRAAVMILGSLLKGLGKDAILQLNVDLLEIYRILKDMYRDEDEDSIIRLHAQVALEELNEIVKVSLFPGVVMEKRIFVLDKPDDVNK